MSKISSRDVAILEIDKLVLPEEVSQKERESYKKHLLNRIEENYAMEVIYVPQCKCKIEVFVLLDRYPMSPKIISKCPECKKDCLLEISDPLVFHDPMDDTDFGIDELDEKVITESFQSLYLIQYKLEADFQNEL